MTLGIKLTNGNHEQPRYRQHWAASCGLTSENQDTKAVIGTVLMNLRAKQDVSLQEHHIVLPFGVSNSRGKHTGQPYSKREVHGESSLLRESKNLHQTRKTRLCDYF